MILLAFVAFGANGDTNLVQDIRIDVSDCNKCGMSSATGAISVKVGAVLYIKNEANVH